MLSSRSRRGNVPIAFAHQTLGGDSDDMAAPSPPMLHGLTAAVTRVVCVSLLLLQLVEQLC